MGAAGLKKAAAPAAPKAEPGKLSFPSYVILLLISLEKPAQADFRSGLKGTLSPKTTSPSGSPKFGTMGSSGSGNEAIKQLLEWAKEATQGYEGVNVLVYSLKSFGLIGCTGHRFH